MPGRYSMDHIATMAIVIPISRSIQKDRAVARKRPSVPRRRREALPPEQGSYRLANASDRSLIPPAHKASGAEGRHEPRSRRRFSHSWPV